MRETLWTLWMYTPPHYTSTCGQRSGYCFFNDRTGNTFKIEQSQSELRVRLLILQLLATGFAIDVNLCKVEIMQRSKESVWCVRNFIHNIKQIFRRNIMCDMLALVLCLFNKILPWRYHHGHCDMSYLIHFLQKKCNQDNIQYMCVPFTS